MEKLKLGIVGLGRLGMEYAKNISHSVHNAELFAACSIEKDEIEHVKNKFGVYNIYDSYDKMLKNKNIDAIIIVSPTDHHPDHIIKALESGFHVFCEKPLAISVSECYRVKKIVDKNKNKIAMLGFVRRYDKSYADAKVKLESGLVGKPFFIRSQTVDKDSYAPFQIEFCKSGGGIFHDFNVHDIDLVHWFSGVNIKKVWSLGGAYRFKEFGEKGVN
jgi:myo-inositol 2-dehydrogenase/D-chiro-inositol 1-dehydrogenase